LDTLEGKKEDGLTSVKMKISVLTN